MRQKPGTKQSHGEKVVKDIRRATRLPRTANPTTKIQPADSRYERGTRGGQVSR